MSEQVLHAVLGTAGHIDHGKSSLVKALTGTDPDRFKEEQDRGMTIDIGFAEYRTPDGVDVGLIDVPGHERFIRNMVAGASGMDLVMLVIASDDSVMPQTREHLEIMTLLGLKRGFVVLTKVDMVDPDLLELVEEDVREFLEGTFLEGAPIIRCSSITGEGIDKVKDQINRDVAALPPRDRSGVFRMPVQRSFTLKGHGTVVTGVPLAGEVAVGDQLELLPAGKSCRVRGIHVHHRPAKIGGAGHRTALNLSDLNFREIHRGDVIVETGFFTPSQMIEARFTLLPSYPGAIRNNTPVRFHAGCNDSMGRLVLLDCKEVIPGQEALVQLRLEDPVVMAPGDRYLLRLASPERTLGGGRLLGETRFRFKRFKDWITENLEGKENSLDDHIRYLEYVIRSEGLHPVAIDRLPRLVKGSVAEVKERLQILRDSGRVVDLASKKEVLHKDMVERGAAEVEKGLAELHEENHYVFGFTISAIASRIKHSIAATQLFVAGASKALERQWDLYRLRSFGAKLSKEDSRLLGRLEEMMREGKYKTPIPASIAEELGKSKARIENVLTLLDGWGRIVKVDQNVYLHRDWVREARNRVVAYCEEHTELPSNQMKDLIGATRKYVIPLLEYFDRLGLTERHDQVRVLKPGYATILGDPSSQEEVELPGDS